MSDTHSSSPARLAPYLAPLSVVAMLGSAVGWGTGTLSAREALVFVMAVAPCGLVNALPVVPFFARRALQRRGIRVKCADVLDRIVETDTLVIDGSSVLFMPPRLANPAQIGSRNMQIAASLGARSDDPLAKALFDTYGGKILDFEKFEANEHGMKAVLEGKAVSLSRYASSPSDLWLDVGGSPCVRFIFAIEPKPETKATLAAIKKDGKRIVFINDKGSDFPATDLGIDENPKMSKQELLKNPHTRGAKVLWFGACKDELSLAPSDVFLSVSDDSRAEAVLPSPSLKSLSFLLSTVEIYERLLARHVLVALTATGLLLALAFSKALSVESGLSALVAFVIGLYFSARQALRKGRLASEGTP